MENIHPAALQVLKYFEFDHLPYKLKEVSSKFYSLAWDMAVNTPNSPELTVGLRKLLEAKDCFVRASLSNK